MLFQLLHPYCVKGAECEGTSRLTLSPTYWSCCMQIAQCIAPDECNYLQRAKHSKKAIFALLCSTSTSCLPADVEGESQ